MKKTSITLFLIVFYSLIIAQISSEYGEVTQEMFELNEFESQPNAKAIVLSNFGQFYGAYLDDGEKMIREYHLKVKILSEEAVKEYANWYIYYYPINKQYVSQASAISYNLDENGEIVKQKIGKKDVLTEKVNEYLSRKVLPIPNVKVGSIVEMKYLVLSPLSYSTKPFYLQMEDPVLQAEFRVQNPNYTSFTSIRSGLKADEVDIQYNGSIRSPIAENRNFDVTIYKVDSLVGIESEPYVNSIHDFYTKIRFQLYAFDNGQFVETNSQDWEELSIEIRSDLEEQFNAISNNSIYKNEVHIFDEAQTDDQKIEAVFSYIRNNYTWNGDTDMDYSSSRLKETYNNKIGSSCQLNMLMAHLLKKEGLNLTPILVSTHENGRVMIDYPYRYQFDNMIWLYSEDNKMHLLDIRDYERHYSVVPKDLLSTKAILLGDDKAKMLTIKSALKWNETNHIVITNFDEGLVEGTVKTIYTGYAALNERQYGSIEKFVESEDEHLKDLDIANDVIVGYEDQGQKLIREYDFQTSEYIIEDEGEILINPIMCFGLTENPFIAEDRILPIDFNYPMTFENRMTIDIPEGFELVDLPDKVIVKKADNGVIYSLQFMQTDNQIQIMSSFKTMRSSFEAVEYEDIFEVFETTIKSQESFIVFKKSL